MNATDQLIEAVQGYIDERANPAMDAGQRSYWRRAMEMALAAAKEERGKVLTDAGYRAGESVDGEFLVWHESNKELAVAAIFPTEHRDWIINLIVSPPILAPAKGSGLTVDGVMGVFNSWIVEIVMDGRDPSKDEREAPEWIAAQASFRKALEALAEKWGGTK